jgi:mono/diheme cytochrome c family protein
VLRAQAARVAQSLRWPGKPAGASEPAARPLTAAEQARFAEGQQQYAGLCASCHQARGTGLAGVAKSLVGSPWVLGPPVRLVRIVMHGKEGQMLMPPVGGSMTDDQMANVLTYIRRAWGNAASPVSPAEVSEVRGATMGRNRPWTEDELSRITR